MPFDLLKIHFFSKHPDLWVNLTSQERGDNLSQEIRFDGLKDGLKV